MGQIGFGTGNLYGGREHARSVALVRAALDAGIDWIDTAPLYGHGAAERIVGEAIAGRRDGLVLVSKVGILPSRLSAGHKLHARLARLAAKLPRGRAILPPPPPRRPQFHVFAPTAIRASVEQSLTALRTDRLDYLLLHECNPGEAIEPMLLEQLAKFVVEGKILRFGTATQREKTAQIAASPAGARFALLQLPSASASNPLGSISVEPWQGVVLHSMLSARLKAVLARLRSGADLRSAAQRLGIDPDQPDLAPRLIAHAARQPSVRAVLFSTGDPGRLKAMASAASLSAEEARAGARLMMEAGDA